MISFDALLNLEGRTAVVTGAGAGIGRATAQRFAASGATLVLADLNMEKAQETGASLPPSIRWEAMQIDVSDWASGDALAAKAHNSFGGADILVNCAGLFPSMPTLELTERHWDQLLDVNLKGSMRLSQCLAPQMIARGGGAIVNVASIQAFRPGAGKAAYASSKAGVVALTQVLARELAASLVRVNAVAPGPIMTETIAAAVKAAGVQPSSGRTLAQVPLGRFGEPDEIARVIHFLATPAAAFVTGATWLVDGGAFLG